jgi:hypothetical protein
VSARNPDVLEAIDVLLAQGRIPEDKAALFARVARGDLVSVRTELRFLLYIGVTLVAAGLGFLANEGRLGPGAILVSLSLASALSFAFVARRAQPFTWGAAENPHLGLDYVLLLAILLLGADLAYAESRFAVLGASWPFHLLLVATLAAALAVRYDSTVVFGFALSTFAAWRGVATSLGATAAGVFDGQEATVRANALGCGVLFALLGPLLRGLERKGHFGGVAEHLGWILILGGLASGLAARGETQAFALALIAAGALLGFLAFRERRFSLLAIGVVGAYVGTTALFLSSAGEVLACQWFAFTPFGVLFLLYLLDRKLKEPR